jgi:hypothetical protein
MTTDMSNRTSNWRGGWGGNYGTAQFIVSTAVYVAARALGRLKEYLRR